MKRFVMFILVLALVVGSVIAADNIFTVGADYSVISFGNTGFKQHFAGGEVALYSYASTSRGPRAPKG